MTRRATMRAGFGLIELLVSISIILTLAGITFLMYPGVRDQDRVRNSVTDVSSTCKLAQAMAARDKRPRGVRFLVGLDATNPTKTDPKWVTELQYVELPEPLIPNPKPYTSANPANEPRVRFDYSVVAAGLTPTNPPAGTIINRRCFIENLTLDHSLQVQTGCTIVMPVFGTWHRIIGLAPAPNNFREVPVGSGRYSGEVFLEVFPDATLGAGTSVVIHHFAIYLLSVPLVGEPTVLLPKNICVDLNTPDPPTGPISVGSLGPSGAGDFDVIFSPDGKLVGAPTGQLFLWVRDYSKGANMRVPQGSALVDGFRRGGEQYFLTIRASGALGHAPVVWPDANPASPTYGQYVGGQTPFSLARQDLNQ